MWGGLCDGKYHSTNCELKMKYKASWNEVIMTIVGHIK